jgi:hypothetical protein
LILIVTSNLPVNAMPASARAQTVHGKGPKYKLFGAHVEPCTDLLAERSHNGPRWRCS